ncbi:p53-induced death domain-containing protein 1 isoform X2 [Varanus komodoensis]|uniref:P53-induced death domain protein 1 n=1 Tax=Varanus komodoensis TaxID=61221 RepID=A0A8D2IZH6_VARKO|nr:p53-induced death domain-containing protein 1 isoform X2 [Varanus komodoensis]
MAGLQELGDPLEEGALGAVEPHSSCLAGNRLNLDVYTEGCHLFLKLFEARRDEVEQVEFLRLSCNETSITSALTKIPTLKGLKSLVLKGGHTRDEFGASQRGLLASLPQRFRELSCLTHLDLSFNTFVALPPCITELANLSCLLVCHNSLQQLPENFGQLTKLTFFSAMKNQLTGLPQSIGELVALQRLDLSENALESLPEDIGNLLSCTELDLSGNLLSGIPNSLAHLQSLQQLHLHSNLLVTVPASLARLPNLSRLDLQNNKLRSVPPEIQSFPFVHLRGNPLGEPEVPLQPDGSHSEKLPKLFLEAGKDSFTVTPEGCRVSLACGVQFCFPRGAASTSVTIHFQKCSPDPHWLKLKHHDILLSEVLELQPHRIDFKAAVQIGMPYASPQRLHDREIIIRTFSGQSWNDLGTRVKGKGKVLPVSAEELQEITDDPETVAGPLLCLSQNATVDFLQPVKIQLPLPPGVTGLTLDRSRIHLLHGDWNAQNWDDITDQVVLEFTHLYVLFEVTHFSWYWLWYTTKTYIGGLAMEVYKRLRMYHVNFIALQRKKDPEQVLLQCVPKHKVDPVLKKLHDRYRGPEPSDMVEMFEGEQFFAGFECGISIDADRPDCIDGRISFNFFSHLKNVKEVYITSELDRKANSVKGQVSFYRGGIPENIPEEVTKRRKGPDSHWLATLPIKLPKLKSQANEQPTIQNGFSLPPLNLGNAETGYLTQSNLLSIAGRIGADWQSIGINLGLSYQQIQQIKYNNREDLSSQILNMLFSWAQRNEKNSDCIDKLINAMKASDRQDIADEITAIIVLGKQKYRESIRRVGLDQESSTEDSAIAMV